MKKYIFRKKYKEYKIGEIHILTKKAEIEFLIKTGTIEEISESQDKSTNVLMEENQKLSEEIKTLKTENQKLVKELEKTK